MTEGFEWPVYDVPLICRSCGSEFVGKSFVRLTADEAGYGLCDSCFAVENGPRLPKEPDPLTDRKTWEPD